MGSMAYHHNKKTGAVYVYSVQSYWDKEKKAPRNKQTYLGILDKETGNIIESRRKRKGTMGILKNAGLNFEAQIAGPSLVLDEIAKQTGVSDILNQCFPDVSLEIMSLVYFSVHKGLPLSRSEPWSRGMVHPFGQELTSQRISDLLRIITEADRQRFLSLWLEKMLENDYLCYDITSISSYAQSNEYVKYGYNRDDEDLPQINLAMLFGQKSGLPAYYRRMPGNISDVVTLKSTIKLLGLPGTRPLHFILDRGFYSESNVQALLQENHHFTMSVPTNRKWIRTIIDEIEESVSNPDHYHEISDTEALYAVTIPYQWKDSGKLTYVHIYYNAQRAAEEFDRFTRRLIRYKQELESGKLRKENMQEYGRYFIVEEHAQKIVKISFNDSEIQRYRKKYAGFFCIVSTQETQAMEALRIYRNKDVVENCFDDLKNQLDAKRLRIHHSTAMDSRLFLQFLALILMSGIRKRIQNHKDLKNLTVREVMENMETLTSISCQEKGERIYTEPSKIQRKIMEAFQIILPA